MDHGGPDGHLTERAHQAMIENGFEPDFGVGVSEQLKQIEHNADIDQRLHDDTNGHT